MPEGVSFPAHDKPGLRGCLKTIVFLSALTGILSAPTVILSEVEESTVNEADRPVPLTPDRSVLLWTQELIGRPLRARDKQTTDNMSSQ